MTADERTGASTGVRYCLTLGEDDVGQRVVLRRRLPDGRLSDLLGVLSRWDDETVAVRSRTGDETVVPRADVVAGKRIPPPPVRRAAPVRP
ncbi:MAG: hypothetical protein AVDCRST_MAG16-555 [uncultured Frankineae bacterium]|uniref:Histone acetyltransferase Rv0428c-like SH3 domain-containing protein n=1 Tax=uncultured Frankineae bacterium TaxID=437475 RepID=A0A6J4KZ35_9ACTN|nr:MAG: hypothetical protein AVDCRST_MAG16-555 [uncultured Frankineae bacterium]